MNCEQALEAISAALDGELSRLDRAKLSEHLLECPECRELAEDLRVLTDTLEDCEQAPPPELAASIRRAVAEEAKPSAPSKKRKAPYLGTVAAMLALCVCLGGIGLFAAGQKGGMSGGAAADNAAPAASHLPEWFNATPEMADGYSGGAAGGEAVRNEPSAFEAEAPMEAAEGMDEMPEPGSLAPRPSASCAPAAPADPAGDSNGDNGTADPAEPAPPLDAPTFTDTDMAPEAAITPEEALELAFEYLGGYEEYPEARRRMVTMYGFDAPAYYLKTVENDVGNYKYCLDYVRLSTNERYYQFRFYEDVTDYRPDGFDHTATSNWLAVSLDGNEILSEFPPNGGDDETWAAYFDAYNSALAS